MRIYATFVFVIAWLTLPYLPYNYTLFSGEPNTAQSNEPVETKSSVPDFMEETGTDDSQTADAKQQGNKTEGKATALKAIDLVISGPSVVEAGRVATISVSGLPPIDPNTKIFDAFSWAYQGALTIEVSAPGEYKITPSISMPIPPTKYDFNVDFVGKDPGLYVVIFAWHSNPVIVAHHRILVGGAMPASMPVHKVIIVPSSNTVSKDEVVTLKAVGQDDDGSEIAISDVEWSSDKRADFTPIPGGVKMIPRSTGKYVVTCTHNGIVGMVELNVKGVETFISKAVRELAERVVTGDTKISEARRLAKNYELIAEKHKNGEIKSIDAGVMELIKLNRAVLGDRAVAWECFSLEYGAMLAKWEAEGKIAKSIDGRVKAYMDSAYGLASAWTEQ